jgi:putative copper resistance protein D
MNMSAMDMAPEWPVALLAWPVILAQALIFGSAMLCLILTLRRDSRVRSGEAFARALAGWWRTLALVVALISPVMFIHEVAGMAGVSLRDTLPLLGEVLAQTHAGHVWRWRLPITFALMLAAWLSLRESVRTFILVILCAGLCLAGSLNSHAIDFGATTVVVRFVHVLAAGAWAGSLFGYWVGTRSADSENQVSVEAARMLSRLAGWSVSILITSGVYIAYEGLGHSLYHLLYSSYGRVLSLKMEVFAVVLSLGAYNRFYLIPTLELPSARRVLARNVGVESLIIFGVIGLAALLAATPPARMSMTVSLDAPRVPTVSPYVSIRRPTCNTSRPTHPIVFHTTEFRDRTEGSIPPGPPRDKRRDTSNAVLNRSKAE